MKSLLLLLTIVPYASFANANTKGMLDARAMTLKQWNSKPGTRASAQAPTPKKPPLRCLLTVQVNRKII